GGKSYTGTLVVWVHPQGKKSLWKDGQLTPAAKQILDKGAIVLAPDLFWSGESECALVQLEVDAKKLQALKLSAKDIHQAIDKSKLFEASTAKPLGEFQYLLRKDRAADSAKSLSDLTI